MSAKQEKSGSTEHLSLYLPKELAAELREVISLLPYSGTSISGFVAGAIKNEIARLREAGIIPRK